MADVQKLMENLKKEGFETSCFETKTQALEYLCEKIKGCSVAFGGCQTAKEMNLYEHLEPNNKVIWHWMGDEQKDAAFSDVYITSANGVAETGELVNIDGTGNRVASTMFGHKKVYYIIGVNKIEPDLHKAIWRARNIAAPLNARRLERKTPCTASEELKCFDCNSPDRICRGMVIQMEKMKSCECEVVIINESLGM